MNNVIHRGNIHDFGKSIWKTFTITKTPLKENKKLTFICHLDRSI